MRDSWNEKDFIALNDYLIEISQQNYKKFSQKLIPNCNNMLGIRIPVLRDMARQIAKGNWKSFVESVGDEYFETTMLHGFVLGYIKADCSEILKYLKLFVPKINNWSVCDSVSAGLKFTLKNRQEVLVFLNEYLKSKNEFEVRFAVVMLMDYYITDEYIDMVLETLQKIDHNGYYVKMAVAWAISVCFVKYQEKTMGVLRCSERLDSDTYNKALQKIIESNRVNKDQKAYIRTLKK